MTACFIRSFSGVLTTLASLGLLTAASNGGKDVEAVIQQFNAAVASNDVKRMAALFTAQGTYRAAAGPALPVAEALRRAAPKRLPWDERMPLTISIQKIELPKLGTALVEATQSDSSPAGETRSWSCVFVLVRAGSGWKISSYAESPVRHGWPGA